MRNKKLALLLGKLPEDKQAAFVADMKSAGPDGYAKVIAQYGIALTEDEKVFLAADASGALEDEDLQGVAGGILFCPFGKKPVEVPFEPKQPDED